MSCLFIADLHLKSNDPSLSQLAISLFNSTARDYDKLFILGDFVEYWLGDDAADPQLTPVFEALKALSLAGTEVYIMLGNRDFLFGEAFAEQYHLTLITDDEYLFEDEDQQILLMHGDTLCTDDRDYQQLRNVLRNPAWQQDFLSKSINERIKVADDLRKKSQKETGDKPKDIMDVNKKAINEALARHSTTLLIHGHTHRPEIHHDTLDTDNTYMRVVVGSWSTNGAMIASLDANKLELIHYKP